jgi:flagellar biosynthesis/type III secretory pathway M-ring protein FliF/YscJ
MRLTIQEAAAYLAQGAANSPANNQGEDFGKSSPVALLLLIVFAIAVVFLIRSMTRHLKKVPATFDEQPAAPQPQDARSAASEPADDQQPGEEEDRESSRSEQHRGSGSRA